MQIQYARLTDEAVYNTFQTGALASAIWYPHIGENALSFDPSPGIEELTFYTGHIIPGIEYSDRVGFGGTLRFPMMPTMEGVLKYGHTPVSDVLPSFSLDGNDGIELRRITGCRVGRSRVGTSSRQGAQTMMVEYTFTGTDSPATPPVFTEPASTSYLFGTPYNHSWVTLTLGGTGVTNIAAAEAVYNNHIFPAFDEFSRISTLNYFGRELQFNVDLRIKTNAERLSFQNQTPYTFSMAWTQPNPGTHSITFAAGTVYIRERTPRRPLREDQYQSLTFHPIRDATSGTDATLTVV